MHVLQHVQIKGYTGCTTTKTKTITVHVDHYWCVVRNTAAPLETPNPVFTYFRKQCNPSREMRFVATGSQLISEGSLFVAHCVAQ